jgi:aminoglycoside phosphotransferase (APT) family kinase protein
MGTASGPPDCMSNAVPGAGAVRDEDSFDVAAVNAWLEAQPGVGELSSAVDEPPGPMHNLRGLVDELGDPMDNLRDPGSELGGPPEVRQFSGGASNLTYLLRYPTRELILRRAPPGTKAVSAHDMAREFRIQQALAPVYPYVPRMVGLCEDPAVIGATFYVMERIEGTILRAHIPTELGLDQQATRALCESAIDRLVELHEIDVAAAGLSDLDRGADYVGRQVEGWSQRYRDARTRQAPSYAKVMRWLAEHQPADLPHCMVHNDFRLDNLVLDPQDPRRIVGVLDWEMATVGDPLMDLGGALAYWVQADDDRVMQALRRQPTHRPGMLTRAELVEHYAQRTGRELEDWSFYEVFGLFRLAVIVQQIYQRYHLRQNRNPAFRHYWLAVRYLDWRCRKLIARAS